MKFGPIPVTEAKGAILAHSLHLADGRLRKGRILTGEDVARITAANITDVTVAQLEPGDVPEDEAAARLAAALVPDRFAANVRVGNAGTGRVNLGSTIPGVAQIDAAAIHAVNAIDPMITVATVPEWQRMAAGGMVATVKIISYAVPEDALERACTAAKGALSVLAPVLKTAQLIQTDVGGGAGKGFLAMQGRLAALAVKLLPETTVPHIVDQIAQAVTSSPADLVLILTGSATSDIHDTAPSAVVAAGGTVTHFGMPVDPGNLLFLGEVGGKPVIGLPGCARSPALNGADWVLERIVCGVPVTSAEIAGMGVGGLLKEIPTRPQPRRDID